MQEQPITVLIADDTEVARDGLRAMLRTADHIQVVGETDSIFSVSRLIQELSPDVLLLDLKWYSDRSVGWIKIREVKEIDPEIKIIAITAYEELIPDARKAGADEVLTKNFRREELLDLIKSVMVRKVSRHPEDYYEEPKVEMLTPREVEVLRLLEKGLTDKEISRALGIEVNTTKNHVKSILQKLGAENRRKAVVRAQEMNLIRDRF